MPENRQKTIIVFNARQFFLSQPKAKTEGIVIVWFD